MKVYTELDLNSFEAWSGGEETLDRIREEGKTADLEALLEDLYPDGIDETNLNDILRFEDDWLYRSLGMMTNDELEAEKEAAEAEEREREEAKQAEAFEEFCATFDMDCSGCPFKDMDGDCEDHFANYRERADENDL